MSSGKRLFTEAHQFSTKKLSVSSKKKDEDYYVSKGDLSQGVKIQGDSPITAGKRKEVPIGAATRASRKGKEVVYLSLSESSEGEDMSDEEFNMDPTISNWILDANIDLHKMIEDQRKTLKTHVRFTLEKLYHKITGYIATEGNKKTRRIR